MMSRCATITISTCRKTTNTGGWQYHQDYGYHYQEFLYPQFVSVMIALNAATRNNGCLKVIRGSHTLGEHRMSGSQLIATETRVALALGDVVETLDGAGIDEVAARHWDAIQTAIA